MVNLLLILFSLQCLKAICSACTRFNWLAEVELVSVVSRETMLKKALAPVRDEYDFIIIDCPPSLGLLTLNAFTAADSVLIPIQSEFYALEGLVSSKNHNHGATNI